MALNAVNRSIHIHHILTWRMTYSPHPGKLYLKLLHGRGNPKEEMNDWGFNGPWVGPLKAVHFTYGELTGLYFSDGAAIEPGCSDELFHNGLFVLDGNYYGDWELVMVEENRNG